MEHRDCDGILRRRVKLGYVPDCGTCVQLVDSIGNQVFDMLPVIQAGETDTSIALLNDIRRIRYYPEKWTRTEGKDGCYYDLCIPDIEALMLVNEIGNVEDKDPLETGDTLVYNADTEMYEMFNLNTALADIDTRINNLQLQIDDMEDEINDLRTLVNDLRRAVTELTEVVGSFNNRLLDIENAIYNWSSDKTTKIPRGTINITSGGPTSNWIIQSRDKNQDQDLDFQ